MSCFQYFVQSDSEDDEFKTKKKTSGVRGRRGFSKKKSAEGENGHMISESSTVYTSRVTKCFNDLVSNKMNDEIRHALIDNINAGKQGTVGWLLYWGLMPL